MNAMAKKQSGEPFTPHDFFPAIGKARELGAKDLIADLKGKGARVVERDEG